AEDCSAWPAVRRKIEDLIDEIERSRLLPEPKRLEWLASCYAGLAGLREGAGRIESLGLLHKQIARGLALRGGRGTCFRVDPHCALAHRDQDERQRLEAILTVPPARPSVDRRRPGVPMGVGAVDRSGPRSARMLDRIRPTAQGITAIGRA